MIIVDGKGHYRSIPAFELFRGLQPGERATFSYTEFEDFKAGKFFPQAAATVFDNMQKFIVPSGATLHDWSTHPNNSASWKATKERYLQLWNPAIEMPAATPPIAVEQPAQPDVPQILSQRGKVHGNFQRNSEIAIGLLSTILEANKSRVDPLRYDQLNALLMIGQKISRILAGNANHPDHWVDIQGYAKLAQDGSQTPDPNRSESA